MGLGLGDDKTASFDIVTRDFLSESFFPYTSATTAAAQPLENAFISASRISDLAILLKINIVQKLIPGLSKPGYTEDSPAPYAARTGPPPNPYTNPLRVGPPPNPYADPLRYPPPHRPMVPSGADRPPGFDDDYEILTPPHGGGYGGRHPLSIGADDLGPPGLGPRAPFFDGMHPTGDHPMFGGSGGGGGGGGVPGARYDPVGPGDVPMGGLRGPRGPYGGFGGRGGFGGGGAFGGGGGYGGYGGGDFV